ncbi:MAG TPA: glycosyltransferase [Tepidisphaeraceae bacterium]|nr:glycosyltransferase [Tepidisphaeraceae bacterium]
MLRVLVPYRDAGPFLAKCLTSIAAQAAPGWTAYLLDDHSREDGGAVARATVGDDERFVCLRNAGEPSLLSCYWQLVHRPEVDPTDVCVCVDADDWLPDDGVFGRVQAAYRKDPIWLTWGSFARGRAGAPELKRGSARPLADPRRIRRLPWVTSHLKTFKAGLFRRISPACLTGGDGRYLPSASDMALMFPMVEMAGRHRIRFLPELNYVYNVGNPRSVSKTQRATQRRVEAELRGRTSYALLDPDCRL